MCGDSQATVPVPRPPHGQAFKVYVPHNPSNLAAGGLLLYGLLNGTNLLVGDGGTMNKVDRKFCKPRDEEDRSKVLG